MKAFHIKTLTHKPLVDDSFVLVLTSEENYLPEKNPTEKEALEIVNFLDCIFCQETLKKIKEILQQKV